MNRSLLEDQVYDWGRFKKTGPHTRTNITLLQLSWGAKELVALLVVLAIV